MKKLSTLLSLMRDVVWLGLFLSLFCLQAQEEVPLQDTLRGEKALPVLIVTPRKQLEKTSAVGKNIFTISEDQLQHSEATDLSQLLNQTGLTISGAVSNPSEVKSLFIRGAASKYSVMMIDGVPLFDPSGTGAAYDLRILPAAIFSSIEVMRGGHSTLYGSGAVAGVVNLRSREPITDKPLQVEAQASGGNLGQFRSSLGLSGTLLRPSSSRDLGLAYNIDITRNQINGISAALDTLKTDKKDFDRDPLYQSAVATSFYISHKNLVARPYFRYTLLDHEYDRKAYVDDRDNNTNLKMAMYGLHISLKHPTAAQLHFKLSQQLTFRKYEQTTGDISGDEFEYDGIFSFADLYTNYDFSDHVSMLLGAEYRQENMSFDEEQSTLTIAPYTMLYTQPLGKAVPLHIDIGGRANIHSEYGSNSIYSVNPFYVIGGHTKLYATYSTSFRAPSLTSLFGRIGPNPNLNPEKANNTEVGINHQGDRVSFLRFSLRTAFFYREIKDQIVYSSLDNMLVNQGEQKNSGMELEPSMYIRDKLQLSLAYAYVENNSTNDNVLTRRPKHTYRAQLQWTPTFRWMLRTNFQAIGKREDIDFSVNSRISDPYVTLNAYSLLSAYASYAFLKKQQLRIFLDIKNLLNEKDYAEVLGYSTLGTRFMLGVHLNLPTR